MSDITTHFDHIQKATVQIATPQCTGKGVVLSEHGLIVTHQHLVDSTPEVVISNPNFQPHLGKVLFTDEIYDLAFIELPTDFPAVSLSFSTAPLQKGDKVFCMESEQREGTIIQTEYPFINVNYLQTSICIDTEYSGSPLINDAGEIVASLTGLLQNGFQKVGYALPHSYILKAIEDYKNSLERIATRCRNCETIITNKTIAPASSCSSCGESVELPSQILPYKAKGISRTIEKLIKKQGFRPELSRRGPNLWALIQGSATIFLSYYERKGYITGDAFLCQFPENGNTDKIYEFLLRQNYKVKGLTFSINQRDIVLSLIIYDRHLNTDTAQQLLQNLLEQADYYDNVLVEEYGAIWKR